MDVTPLKPKEVDNVQISDIHDFFVEYIENDNLGLIANAHLVRADQSDDGVSDPMCMKLAQLHSHAVGKFVSGWVHQYTWDTNM